MVIKSEEELRGILREGGRLSYSKRKKRWLVYREGPSGIETTYVSKDLEQLCEGMAAEAETPSDEALISEVVKERRVTAKPIEAERIERLKYAERVTTLIGRHAQHIFADTVKVEDGDWKGSDEQQAQRIAERYLEQMKREHDRCVSMDKLGAGDNEERSKVRRILETYINTSNQLFAFYRDRDKFAKRVWWQVWETASMLHLVAVRRLLERLGYATKEGEMLFRETMEEIQGLYLGDEESMKLINVEVEKALRMVEEKEGLKILDDDGNIYVPTINFEA